MDTHLLSDLVVEVRGPVSADSADYARARLAGVAKFAPEPILHARVKLTEAGDPAVAQPAMAQANLDLNGRFVRAHATASDMREAIDDLRQRLIVRLERASRRWEARRGTMASADQHEWRHGAQRSRRPPYYPRPREQRQIVRHKSFTLAVESPAEAVLDMELMDYDFTLFTDRESGLDAVVYRTGASGYRMACTQPRTRRPEHTDAGISLSPHAAPRLGVIEAIERLELTGLPFVFFVDAPTGRGNVLYHRYDGHYGLITPA